MHGSSNGNRRGGNGHSRRRPDTVRGEAEESRETSPHAGLVEVVEVLAESAYSWEDAAASALAEVEVSGREIKSIYVKDMQAIVERGRVVAWRLNAKISFAMMSPEGVHERARDRERSRTSSAEPRGDRTMGRMEEGMRQSRDEREEEQNRYEGREEQRGWEAREERGGRGQGGYMGSQGSREERYLRPGSESWDQSDYGRGRRNMGAYGEERFGESGRFGGRERMGGPYGQREFAGQGERPYGMSENRGQYGGEFGGGYGQSGQYGGGRVGHEQWGRGQWGSAEYGQPYGQGRPQWAGREYDQPYGQGRGQWAGREYDQPYGQGRGQWAGREYDQPYGQGRGQWAGSEYDQPYGQERGQWGRGEYGPQVGQGRPQWGRGQWGERQGSVDESWGPRRFGPQEGGADMGDQLSHFGGAMAGRVRRMFRSPKGYKRSDDRIREDICDQLSQEAQLDPGDIEVSVSNGEVTLSGTVPERYMKWQTEQLIDNVSGVNEIHNQLRIRRQDMSMGSTGSQQTGGMAGTPANTQVGTRSQSRS